jgi:hypothetical protein
MVMRKVSTILGSENNFCEESKVRYKRRGLTGTKPRYLLTDYRDVTCPGFLEAGTVAHCGNSMARDFVWSINTNSEDDY